MTGEHNIVGNTGVDGVTLSQRLEKFGSFVGSSQQLIYFGNSTGREAILSLAICDGDRSRSYRRILFNNSFRKAGVGAGPHSVYKSMYILNLVEDFNSIAQGLSQGTSQGYYQFSEPLNLPSYSNNAGVFSQEVLTHLNNFRTAP